MLLILYLKLNFKNFWKIWELKESKRDEEITLITNLFGKKY